MELPPSKLPHVGTTIFSVMSALAQKHGAINLGQGFPGFSIDSRLIDEVQTAMREGHNQYAPMPGYAPLVKVIAQKIEDRYGHRYDSAAEITITAGATQALYAVFAAFVQPGDEVILFAPAYDSYAPAIRVHGGEPVWVKLREPNYQVDWDEVASKITSRTRMIVINSPNNPTGSVWSAEDMDRLQSLLAGTNIILLSDEVYEHLVFDGAQHASAIRYPELVKRACVVFSFGKTFHATGWKMGYVCAPADMMNRIRQIHQYLVFSVNTPIQVALHRYMQDSTVWNSLASFYQAKRDRFIDQMQGSAWELLPCNGTYFQLLRFTRLSDKSDMDMAKHMTEHVGVTMIPCSAFYEDGYDARVLRLCFAKEDHVLDEAAHRLKHVSIS